MTKAHELTQILTICEAQYAKCQQAFAQLCAREAELRAELVRLGEMGRQAQSPTTELSQMRAIGADIIWQSWLGRSKTALNTSLAQVLAVKETHIQEVRQSYGKLLVVQDLLKDLQNESRKKARQAGLSQAIEMSLNRVPGSQ